jgi:hypothetical protein
MTDVAMDCLDAMIHALKDRADFCASFDAEGWTFKVLSDDYRTYVIEEKNGPVLHSIERINKSDLAYSLYDDILRCREDWAWDEDAAEDGNAEAAWRERLEEIERKLCILQGLLKEQPMERPDQ